MYSIRKNRFIRDTVIPATLTIVAAMSVSGTVLAQGREGAGYHRRDRSAHEHFVMGVCVGQTLAQRGVTLPMPEPGRPAQLDESQQDALQGAIDTCRASMTGRASPTPSPTALPSVSPAPVPAPVPSVDATASAASS